MKITKDIKTPCTSCANAFFFGKDGKGIRCVAQDWSTPDIETDPVVPQGSCPDFEPVGGPVFTEKHPSDIF